MKISNKVLIVTAQVISLVFSPFYFPVVAFIVLFFFSYMNYLPWTYNLIIVLMVYGFTVFFPWLGIYLYRKINGWTRHQLGKRERRVIPYVISILCYTGLLTIMQNLRMPRFTMGLIITALVIQIVCAIVNSWVKVSIHAAASGGVIGILMAFSLLFQFDPTFPLSICILPNGLVCTARLILRQHTLTDVWLGTVIGTLCGFFSILLI
ncbi:PAP2 superfamily domain protein [gut metagenome]|uniref:PAP2 superfamily domain protein n=1 Tax=gut metagenome TaxID=749906 RepID=J9FHX8_9ZZZZ